MRFFYLILIGFFAVFVAINSQAVSFAKEEITIRTAEKNIAFHVEIAADKSQQAHGLMYRTKLDADSGMLFLFDEPHIIRMWMKNTPLSLDMLFIDRSGKIVYIARNTIPQSTEIISPDTPSLAVLEVNGGTAKKHGIKLGDKVMYKAFTP